MELSRALSAGGNIDLTFDIDFVASVKSLQHAHASSRSGESEGNPVLSL